jgi:hypothetical protein
MNILIIHLGTPCECFVSTTILKNIKNNNVYVLVKDDRSSCIYKNNQYIKEVFTLTSFPQKLLNIKFDKLINLNPDFDDTLLKFNSKNKTGFNYLDNIEKYYEALYGNTPIKMNLFQIYHRLAGSVWSGEGFYFKYYPKNRTKKDRVGVAVANYNLKNYICNKLKLERSVLWNIPFKNNILKKMDEVNRCYSIITDDFFTMNIALYLRKNIYFLKTIPYNFKIEMFGSGILYDIPKNIL